MDTTYDRKRLDRAFTISIIALLGFFIPILGIILAFIALGINSGVEPHNKRMEKRQINVIAICWLAIILSLVAGYGYYKLYQNRQAEAQQQVQAEAKAVQYKAEKAASDAKLQRDLLNYCLDGVNEWYNSKSTGLHPQEYWDALLASKQQQVQECQIRYQ